MERWVEAVLSPTDQAKCDLLGIRVMCYMGAKMSALSPCYSVRKRPQSYADTYYHTPKNLCRHRPDTTAPEVCIFRSTDEAIKGATNKKYFFPGVT